MIPAMQIMEATFASVITGDGLAGGRGVIVQNKAAQFDNVSGNRTITADANFTAGNSAVVNIAHYQSSSATPSGVTIGGTAATKVVTGIGTTSVCEQWLATGLAGGSATVTITLPAGSGWYIDADVIECSPLTGLDVTANATAVNTAPTMTSAATAQAEELVVGLFRDNTGVNNVVATPVPAPLTQGFLVRDGISSLGGASGYKRVQIDGAQSAVFATTSTQWVGSVGCYKFALPLVHVGTSVQFWSASDAWAPTTQSRVIADTTKLLVTAGAWWDGNGTPSALPTDNHGTFTAALNPTITGESPTTPVVTQICYQLAPSVNTHTITPPAVQSGGDGYFTLLEIAGIDGSTPIRDSGRNRSFHAPVTPPDSNTIQSMAVATDGSLAQVGDTVVAVFCMDPNSTSNSNIAWVPPTGWHVLVNKPNATDNLGVLVCCAVVTTAGKITATATWTDPNTFVADASIVVFKKA
jgi:hypothetical protein